METGKWREFPWVKAGYWLTAGWMAVVLGVTGGNVGHPLFSYIFSVPLGVWAAALVAARLVKGRDKS